MARSGSPDVPGILPAPRWDTVLAGDLLVQRGIVGFDHRLKAAPGLGVGGIHRPVTSVRSDDDEHDSGSLRSPPEPPSWLRYAPVGVHPVRERGTSTWAALTDLKRAQIRHQVVAVGRRRGRQLQKADEVVHHLTDCGGATIVQVGRAVVEAEQ